MVTYRLVIVCFLIAIGVSAVQSKEFWMFPQVTDVQDDDVYLLRRPGQTTYTGARNITGLSLKNAFTGIPGPPGYTPVKNVDYFDGIPGAQGESGPNIVTTSTGTNLSGLLYGESGVIKSVADASPGAEYSLPGFSLKLATNAGNQSVGIGTQNVNDHALLGVDAEMVPYFSLGHVAGLSSAQWKQLPNDHFLKLWVGGAGGEKTFRFGQDGKIYVDDTFFINDADERLRNARTPALHAVTHGSAGSDPLEINAAGVPFTPGNNLTSLNVQGALSELETWREGVFAQNSLGRVYYAGANNRLKYSNQLEYVDTDRTGQGNDSYLKIYDRARLGVEGQTGYVTLGRDQPSSGAKFMQAITDSKLMLMVWGADTGGWYYFNNNGDGRIHSIHGMSFSDNYHLRDDDLQTGSVPLMSGTAAAGNGTTIARSNHVHPSDTSREPTLGNPSVSGQALTSTTAGVRSWATIPRGYDGLDGKTMTCAITGIQSILFDASGLNPVPTLEAFQAFLYRDGLAVTPQSYAWSVPSSKTLLAAGNSTTSATFTPAVFGIFSASKMDNRVTVLLNYSGMQCRAVAAISVTRIGLQGIQGPPGSNATVTKPAVIGAFNTTAGGGPLVMQPSSGEGNTASQFETWDTSSTTRWFVTGDGTAYWKTASGLVITKVDSAGRVTSYDAAGLPAFQIYSGGYRRGLDANGKIRSRETRNGEYVQYNAAGKAVFKRLSSGAIEL
jgi:hypothetical protein